MKQGVCHNCGEIKHLNSADICIDCRLDMETDAEDKEMENRIAREIDEGREDDNKTKNDKN